MSGHWEPLGRDAVPRRVDDSLDRVGRSLGLPPTRALRAVFGRWAETVGEQVAAHTSPVSLRHGTLLVIVDQPAWATQLRYLESDLVRRVSEAVGEGVVERIEVRVRRP